MSTEIIRSPELLHRASSRLLVVDVQEKLAGMLAELAREQLISTCQFLGDAAKVLSIPLSITEQYPKGLGDTVTALQPYCADRPAKKRFSCVECLGWPSAAEAIDDRFQIVVAGMETHVCVLQTVLDLLSAGYQVYVVVDAVASQRVIDQQIAIERMANSGAVLVTAEGVVFEWAETAEATEFKQLSALVKGRGI